MTLEPGRRAARTLIANGVPFTAIFAFNDVTAIGAIQALLDAGIDVPGDVSVVGFDDIPGAIYHRPGLTTVRQPLRSMGESAARLLLQRIEHPRAAYPSNVAVEPELVVRGTSGPVKSRAELTDNGEDQLRVTSSNDRSAESQRDGQRCPLLVTRRLMNSALVTGRSSLVTVFEPASLFPASRLRCRGR